MKNIEILTFTGVDSRTDLNRLIAIQRRYPKVEFAVLIGSNTDEHTDHGIFPNKPTIRNFRGRCKTEGTRSAIHLCGNWSRAVMRGESHYRGIPWHMVIGMCEDFHRVQINLHGDFWDRNDVAVHSQRVIDFAEEVMHEDSRVSKIILQHRETFESVPIHHDDIEYLFDKSGGAGTPSFEQWPFPSALRRSGYAGGLGPNNIGRAIAFADAHHDLIHASFPMWFDMESGVRTGGWFDLDAVENVCQQVFPEE